MEKDYSQNGESKIIASLFKEGYKGYFIDLGAGDGYHLSNTRYFKEIGWEGLMVDADNKGNDEVLKRLITLSNVSEILADAPAYFDFLSVDLDGNDYHIISEALMHCCPSLICFEINSQLPIEKSIVMPYNAAHVWDGTNAYGMSYLAGIKLCDKWGYKIYDIINGTNIIAYKEKFFPNIVSKQEIILKKTWPHPEKEIKWQEV